MVIRDMVRQFALPIEIVAGETRRADDGLALSSRNGYLATPQRAEAVQLSRALQAMAAAVQAGERDFAAIEARAMDRCSARGWQPDYMALRRRADLQAADRRRAPGGPGGGAAGKHPADRQPGDPASGLIGKVFRPREVSRTIQEWRLRDAG